jgi:hypothetical protein
MNTGWSGSIEPSQVAVQGENTPVLFIEKRALSDPCVVLAK